MKARMRAEGAYAENVRGSYLPRVLHTEELPKLYLDWIEVVGPLQGEFPPPSLATVFGEAQAARLRRQRHATRAALVDEARAIFARLLPRAFRRPVSDAEVADVVGLIEAELDRPALNRKTHLKTGVVAMLCSPQFLFLFEPAPPMPTRRENSPITNWRRD